MDNIDIAFIEGYELAVEHCLKIYKKISRGESAMSKIRKLQADKEKCLKELKKRLKK